MRRAVTKNAKWNPNVDVADSDLNREIKQLIYDASISVPPGTEIRVYYADNASLSLKVNIILIVQLY